MSQMHVSRLLKRAFRELRSAYGDLDDDAEDSDDADDEE